MHFRNAKQKEACLQQSQNKCEKRITDSKENMFFSYDLPVREKRIFSELTHCPSTSRVGRGQ